MQMPVQALNIKKSPPGLFLCYNFWYEKDSGTICSTKKRGSGAFCQRLAIKSNLDLTLIEDIESGKELFLSVTVRQNLAKGLKCHPEEIRRLEKDFRNDFVSLQIIESLKELILNGAGGLKCPKCGAPLVTKVERMYDLEDNLVLHPKAHCTKCVFQIH